MDHRNLAQDLSATLQLDTPPIALTFVDTIPAGVQAFDREVPSACTFWRRAETSVFYAAAEQHFNCPVGAMTMGFDLPPNVQDQLMMFVEKMCACNYVSTEEPAKIPVMQKKSTGIVYGPLADFPLEPDLILMWITAHQTMLFNEAIGSAHWTASSPGFVFGRPGCAALPVAATKSDAALSLGCAGMRTFTDISDNRLLAVLPGAKVQEFLSSLQSVVAANTEMLAFYQGHKAQFSS